MTVRPYDPARDRAQLATLGVDARAFPRGPARLMVDDAGGVPLAAALWEHNPHDAQTEVLLLTAPGNPTTRAALRSFARLGLACAVEARDLGHQTGHFRAVDPQLLRLLRPLIAPAIIDIDHAAPATPTGAPGPYRVTLGVQATIDALTTYLAT